MADGNVAMADNDIPSRVVDWLNDVSPLIENKPPHNVVDDSQISPLPTSSAPLKRKRMEDITPRPKRVAMTPTSSNRDSSEYNRLSEFARPLAPSTTTGRSSSPSKRKRDNNIEFSTVAVIFEETIIPREFDHEQDIPQLSTLLAAIAGGYDNTGQDLDSEIDELCRQVDYCTERNGTEECWSDLVVLPSLMLSVKLSQCRQSTEIINVKSIDIFPKDLLPVYENASIPTKRVDYTIGIKFCEQRKVHKIIAPLQDHTLNQSDHKMLRDRILCSHIEIKTSHNTVDGHKQLGVWCAAGFTKMHSLWLDKWRDQVIQPLAPMPLWLWCENVVKLFVAVKDPQEDRIDVKLRQQWQIRDAASLRNIVQTMARVIVWGNDCYREWFTTFFDVYP